MASTFLVTVTSFLLLLLAIHTTISTVCHSQTLCADLPTLNISLHWNYSAANSSLSIAFVAASPSNTRVQDSPDSSEFTPAVAARFSSSFWVAAFLGLLVAVSA